MEDSYVFWIVLLTKHMSLVNHSIVYFFYHLHVYTYKGLSCLPSCWNGNPKRMLQNGDEKQLS